jgi:hypothetical protein
MMRVFLSTKNLVFFIPVIFFLTTSFDREKKDQWFCEELKYTYQIEVVNARKSVSVTTDFCDMIRSNRSQSEIVTVQLDSNVFLKIFPFEQIKDLDEAERSIKEIIYL